MKNDKLIELCGEIITFLKINRIKNKITSVDNTEFDLKIQYFSNQLIKTQEDMNFTESRKEQIKNQGPVKKLDEKIWAKMDKFDRDFYKRSLLGELLESEKEDVLGAIYDHESCGNWGVAQVLRTLKYKND